MRGATFAVAVLASASSAQNIVADYPVKKVAEVATGFFQELAYLNRLDSLEKCEPYSEELLQDLGTILSMAAAGEVGNVFEAVVQLAGDIIPFVWNCRGTPEEIKAMVDWLETTCASKQGLVDVTSARSHVHTQEI